MDSLAEVTFRDFKWVEETSRFNKDFIESYNEDNAIRYFLEVDVQYPEELHEFHNFFLFYQKEWKFERLENF